MSGSLRAAGERLIVGLVLIGAAMRAKESDHHLKQTLGPPFPISGPATAAWREEALVRRKELEALADWITQQPEQSNRRAARLRDAVEAHLDAVLKTAADDNEDSDRKRQSLWERIRTKSSGANVERTLGNLDAAEAHLIRLAPKDYVQEQMPSFEAHVNRFLPKADPRRIAVDAIARNVATNQGLGPADAGTIAAAHHAASSQRRREMLRVRSFRNVVLCGTVALVPVVMVLAYVGWKEPAAIPLCFYPEEEERVVCPLHTVPDQLPGQLPAQDDIDPYVDVAVARGDMLLIEFIGLVAAAAGVALTVRKLKGTSTPYNVPLALAVLKLPLGALTAVIGLLLMSAGFVPGLTALDTSAQILGWALVFGYAQHFFTRLIDQRAATLLDAVGGRGAAGDREAGPGPVG
ncbi:MAG TPA: hypothetical protein VFP78_06480 [Solirubrobacteraceae bacterium]|nr:hypothetical protein [Solirubrobacteraceae bacterium]